jgi:dipeptidyl aminopeptidase B
LPLHLESHVRYFTATRKSAVERHLYSVDLTGNNLRSLTDTTKEGYYQVSFSSLAHYYQLSYSGPGIPYQSVRSTSDPTFELVLENNEALNKSLQHFDLPIEIHGTINIQGFTLNYKEIRPPNFDDSGKTKYPVLFNCYGGPVSQTVDKKFLVGWHQWLASEPRLEYITVQVDGRGTGFMGRKSRAGVRGRLGELESYDQAAAASYFPFFNSKLDFGNKKII